MPSLIYIANKIHIRNGKKLARVKKEAKDDKSIMREDVACQRILLYSLIIFTLGGPEAEGPRVCRYTANILIVNITIFYRVSFIIVIWS